MLLALLHWVTVCYSAMAELQDVRILDRDDPLLEREDFNTADRGYSRQMKKHTKVPSEEQLNYR